MAKNGLKYTLKIRWGENGYTYTTKNESSVISPVLSRTFLGFHTKGAFFTTSKELVEANKNNEAIKVLHINIREALAMQLDPKKVEQIRQSYGVINAN